LGFDASGLPAIDYFLADPYVLPESAGEYYTETIWRLPQTYVAVDGFEVAVPTLRRDRMEIPQDAVVYFSAQSGAKRNPSNVRAQIQILKEVPNSFLLIKNLRGEIESVKHFFETIAESEGVSSDRLRFLPRDSQEAIHRGNLRIADVVLDTYPYNGATTTLETLWMEIPLVTQVGKQFAARNSYTMLRNAGVTAGIAWNQEEYIEWGIRLGKNPQLRRDIAWQLRVGKQTEPLWNSEQFTRDLEQAYEQMWQKFVDES
jgi:predicted O-linked N-acetylglucosamine transferase (SPINDLY family)